MSLFHRLSLSLKKQKKKWGGIVRESLMSFSISILDSWLLEFPSIQLVITNPFGRPIRLLAKIILPSHPGGRNHCDPIPLRNCRTDWPTSQMSKVSSIKTSVFRHRSKGGTEVLFQQG